MLSYRHAYHAANHADVLKHMVLCLILRHLNKKDKPYTVIDTHSGAGMYDLKGHFADMKQEYKKGYNKVKDNEVLRNLVPEYYSIVDKVREENPDFYPGSPYFSSELMRENDRMLLSDLHPTDEQILFENFRKDSRINVQRRDGLESLKGILPPTPRRGLCFIDPSYEEKNEYYDVAKAVKHALQKWNVGIIAVWYPVLGKLSDHSKNLTNDLKRLGYPLLQAELNVSPQDEVRGMNGSGMLVLNYPFGLYEDLSPIMQELYSSLCAKDGTAKLKLLIPQK